MKDRKIGERFEYEGFFYKVVPALGCDCCDLYDKCHTSALNRDISGLCSAISREDNKSVIFVRLNEMQLIKGAIDDLLREANQMEEAYAGRKEEEFYSGMIHGLDLLKEFIKRKFQSS